MSHIRRETVLDISGIAPDLLEGFGFANRPPLITPAASTTEISVQRGRRQAPAKILLAIAEGLATDNHWWLYPREMRKNLPSATTMAEVETLAFKARQKQGQWASTVRFRLDNELFADKSEFETPPSEALEWTPFMGGDLNSNYARKVRIRVEEGADFGEITWNTGTGKGSAFIASILCLLPGFKDHGEIRRSIEADDATHAQWAATVLKAVADGVKQTIYSPNGQEIVSGITLQRLQGEYAAKDTKNLVFSPGYRPRRSYDLDGREIAFAPLRTWEQIREMARNSQPLPFVIGTSRPGLEMPEPSDEV